MNIQEAAAEARGLGRGLQPALPADAAAAAVAELLLELGCYSPPQVAVGMAGNTLSPADSAEVADSPANATRFDERGKARRTGVEYAATLAAETLVTHLKASGFVVMRRRLTLVDR